MGWLCIETSRHNGQWYSLTCFKDERVLPVFFRHPLESELIVARGVIFSLSAMVRARTTSQFVMVDGHFVFYKVIKTEEDVQAISTMTLKNLRKVLNECDSLESWCEMVDKGVL